MNEFIASLPTPYLACGSILLMTFGVTALLCFLDWLFG